VKLVVDVNVQVSGSRWSGNPARLVDALLDGSATLCASSLVLAEFEEAIQREKFQTRLEQKGQSAREII
jgi:predicted nucleic acid-binding protein